MKCKRIYLAVFILVGFLSLNSLTILAEASNQLLDGTLIRPKGHSNVFVIQKGKKHSIQNIEIFNSYGYRWEDVKEVDQSIEQAYHISQLVKLKGDSKVYYGGYSKKFWIRTPEAFLATGFKSVEEDVIEINEYEMNFLEDMEFVQRGEKCPSCGFDDWYTQASDDRQTVYKISDFGTKRAIRSAEIYESYGNNWADISIIPYQLVDALPDTSLVRAQNDYKVYKLENGFKHWVINEKAFFDNGFSFNQVEEVSVLDLNLYELGAEIR
jgi:hypothetical protein